jgi:hypothetical protein
MEDRRSRGRDDHAMLDDGGDGEAGDDANDDNGEEPDDEPELDDDDDGGDSDDDSTISGGFPEEWAEQLRQRAMEWFQREAAAAAWEWIIHQNRMQSENPPHSHEDLVAELRRLEHDAALARESQERRERSAGTREGFGPFGPSTFPGEAGVTARDDRDDGDDGEAVNGDGVDEWLAVLES